MKNEEFKIAAFKGENIRWIFFNHEWWFSVIDVIEVLTGSSRSRKYWNLKSKLIKEGYSEASEKIGQLKLQSPDGKLRETDERSEENRECDRGPRVHWGSAF